MFMLFIKFILYGHHLHVLRLSSYRLKSIYFDPDLPDFFSNPVVCIEKFKRFEGFILFMQLMLFGNSSPCLMSYVNRLSSYVNRLSSYVLHPDS